MSASKRKQERQLSFSFPDKILASVTRWTTIVTKFYSDTLHSLDPNTYESFSNDVHIAKMRKEFEASIMDSSDIPIDGMRRSSSRPLSPTQDMMRRSSSTAGMISNTTTTLMTTAVVGGGSGNLIPPSLVTESNAHIPLSQIPDALESLTVHYVVQLTSLLGHPHTTIRLSSATLVFQLASILDHSIPPHTLERILVSFETDNHGYHDPVHELFTAVGKSFSIMAIAFVSGLECVNTTTDWRVRGICNTALARLVSENDKIFLQEDHLAAIWNLYFALQSIPLISTIFPDRLVIIKALHLLAPLYTAEDLSLSLSIADALLRLKDKTNSEVESIKNTLKVIFSAIAHHRVDANGSNKQIDTAVVSRPPVQNALSDMEDGNALFLNLVTPHDEFAYDLLSWAYEEYMMDTYAASHKGKRTLPIRPFPKLNEFILSLSNHFRAAPPLVRYGSAVVLHTTLQLCPSFLNENRQMWIFLVAGVLDTDFLTAYLYLSLLEKMESAQAMEVRRMVSQLIGSEAVSADPDDALTIGTNFSGTPTTAGSITTPSMNAKKRNKKVTRLDVLELVVKDSPAIAPMILHKMANAIDYLPLQAKLRQLQLIRVWAKKVERTDSFLLQLIVPLCHSPEERVQYEAVKILQALIPSLLTGSVADLTFIWTNLVNLVTSPCDTKVLLNLLSIMKQFPLQAIPDSGVREEYLNCLFKNVFHQDAQIRYTVYSIIGSSGDFWKLSGLLNAALAVLILSIGDDDPTNARHVMDQIPQLGTPMLAQIFVPLTALREAVGKTPAELVKAYDGLVTAFVTHKADYRPLVDAVGDYERVDLFWNYFLSDVPDNQLARPEEYDYERNFIQNPYWISLFLSKVGTPPPLLGVDVKASREVMPTTTAGKRRFICGFLHCLFPSLGMSDSTLRYTACLAVVRCCFRGSTAHAGMLRSVLEYVTQYLLPNKSWTYQLSALQILGMMVRIKVPGVAESVFQQYLDLALDFLANSPTEMVKVGTLELIEIFLLVFPKALQFKLADIRDGVRALLVDKNRDVSSAAIRIYPLIFRAVMKQNAPEFEQYLHSEARTLKSLSSLEAVSDPLVSHLTMDEAALILRLTVLSMGMIVDTPTSTYQVTQSILKFVAQPNPELRVAGLTAIFSLFQTMDPMESSATMWILLPLFADPSKAMRNMFSRFLKNTPNPVEARCLAVPAHLDDQPNLSLVSWEEILTDTSSITVMAKNLSDLMSPIDDLVAQVEGNVTIDEDVFHHPIISEKLMKKLKVLAQSAGASVPAATQAEVLYYLNEIGKVPFLKPYVLLILSEFAVAHTQNIPEIGDILLTAVSQDVTVSNYHVVEASLLGLKNIAESSPELFKPVLTKLTSAQIPNEGEFLAMIYLIDVIRDAVLKKIPELVSRYLPIIGSSRHPLRRRIYCTYLTVELASASENDDTQPIVDAVQSLLETIQDSTIRQNIIRAVGKLLGSLGAKHPLFTSIMTKTQKDIRGKDSSKRLEALSLFRIFSTYLSHEERLWYVFYCLADPLSEIRQKAQDAFVQDKILEFAYPSLRKDSLADHSKAVSVISTHLSSLQEMGVLEAPINSNDTAEAKENEDQYNINYYNSSRRRKFSALYGLPETSFAKATAALSEGVIKGIEKSIAKLPATSPDSAAKTKWVLDLDPIAILRALIELDPTVADEIIKTLLTEIETLITATTTNEDGSAPAEELLDISIMSHRIDVLSNLLVAHDGVGDQVLGWVAKLKALIQQCLQSSDGLRENLYNDLERSFFFFNEYVDTPIVSDEHYERLEKFKQAKQDATLEIVKSGRTEQYNLFEAKRNELNVSLDNMNEKLHRLTMLALHMFSGYGIFNAISKSMPPLLLVDELQFMIDLLQSEHRGVRIAAVDGFTTTVKYRNEQFSSQDLNDKVVSTVQQLLKRLSDQYNTLFRRKADIVKLISQMSLIVTNHDQRLAIVQALIRLWRDPDSEVRKVAIQMIQFMGERGVIEVIESFQGELSSGSNNTGHVSSFGMKELVALMNVEEYPEKELLQNLLKWRFSLTKNDVDKIMTSTTNTLVTSA